MALFGIGAAITSAHGDRDGGAVNDRDSVQRRASRRLLRRLLCCKIVSRYGPLKYH